MGACTASAVPVPDGRLRTCCNAGYARGVCPSFPGGHAPDAIRFGIVRRSGVVATIRYVVERDHHPFGVGTLELREGEESDSGNGTLVDSQARAFLHSYLRRREGTDC